MDTAPALPAFDFPFLSVSLSRVSVLLLYIEKRRFFLSAFIIPPMSLVMVKAGFEDLFTVISPASSPLVAFISVLTFMVSIKGLFTAAFRSFHVVTVTVLLCTLY